MLVRYRQPPQQLLLCWCATEATAAAANVVVRYSDVLVCCWCATESHHHTATGVVVVRYRSC
eukprot:COSAG02_NODE_45249_length_359_cov_0.580769_1_plen_62_part_00